MMLKSYRVFLPFFLRQWKRFALFAGLTPLVSILDLGILAGGGVALDHLISPGPSFQKMTGLLLLLTAAYLLSEILRSLQNIMVSSLDFRVGVDLQNELFSRVLKTRWGTFQTLSYGGILKRVLRDAEQVSAFAGTLAALLLREPVRVILFSVLLFYWSPWLLGFMGILVFLSTAVSYFTGKFLTVLYEHVNEQEGVLFQKMQAVFSKWLLVKAHLMEEKESVAWEKETERYYRLRIRAAMVAQIYPIVFRLLIVMGLAALWWCCRHSSMMLFQKPSDWAQVLGVLFLWAHSVRNLSGGLLGLIDEGVRAAKVIEILNWPEEKLNGAVKKKKGSLNQVELRALSFSYDPDRKLFERLTLALQPGDPVILSGPNGSGKTTLAYLILRFLEPQSGELFYNGLPAGEVDLSWLRRQCGMVFQQPQLLEATLTENLFYGGNGNPRPDTEEVLKWIGLEQLIPRKNSEVQFKKIFRELSFGEKQKLSLARAFLHNPEFLILDEPTSGIDSLSEERILKELFSRRREKITLWITHRTAAWQAHFRQVQLSLNL